MHIETESRKPTEHRLPVVLLQTKVRVAVVGCGGTGSAIAAGPTTSSSRHAGFDQGDIEPMWVPPRLLQ